MDMLTGWLCEAREDLFEIWAILPEHAVGRCYLRPARHAGIYFPNVRGPSALGLEEELSSGLHVNRAADPHALGAKLLRVLPRCPSSLAKAS